VSTERVLVVDDEPGIVAFVKKVLEKEGLRVASAPDGERASALLERESFHLMITDLKMPGLDGMELLRRARSTQPEMEVIVLTAHGTVETAVEAMKLGAFDYLTKPIGSPDELRLVSARALERRRLREEHSRRRIADAALADLVAVDASMVAIVTQIRKVAPTDATVLLLGESGTGKELLARAIHRQSKRSEGPFVAVNCGALAETLLESELFGHEKGAFTGATAVHRGRFEMADTGTLFLDEVTELKPSLQVKLLRVLQERTFERVGGTRAIEVDIRLIAASNRDLKRAMAEGRLRDDLYHRLAVFPVSVPPLRERPGDILPIAEHLIARLAIRLGRAGLALDDAAKRKLSFYDWPGNVRELLNVLERAAILAESSVLSAADLFGLDGALVSSAASTPALEGTLEELEKDAIQRALTATGGHRKRAAARLGIGLRTLYEKLKQYGIGQS
jgi:two-component system, NtrC family, response regulator AtoC